MSCPAAKRAEAIPTTGIALTAASVLFLLGTSTFVPEVVLDLGLVVLAMGIAWAAIWLLGRSRRITTSTPNSTPAVRQTVTV